MIIRVTPPKHIRDLLRPENAQILSSVLNNGPFDPSQVSSDASDNDGRDYTAEQLDSIAHIIGARQLEIDTTEANKLDDPESYIYSVQLLQGDQFTGSIINTSSKNLERDRQKWNKALLKKYLKESIMRDPAVGSPWMCKERLRLEYGFSSELPEHLKVKSNELRVDLLQRRRKVSRIIEGFINHVMVICANWNAKLMSSSLCLLSLSLVHSSRKKKIQMPHPNHPKSNDKNSVQELPLDVTHRMPYLHFLLMILKLQHREMAMLLHL